MLVVYWMLLFVLQIILFSKNTCHDNLIQIFKKKMSFFVILGLKINPASSSLKIWQFENNDFIYTANQMFIFEWQ